jgi:predicted lipid-binding transport protein (Tim44 family)
MSMRKFLGIMIALIGLSLIAVDADARRMGGGRSIGKQREAINPNQAAPKAPAQQPQQANPAAPTQKAAAAPAQQPSGMSRFLGPLAGLAIGAGLAALFFNNGLGGALMGILMLAALAFAAMMLFRFIRGRMNPQPLQQPLRYAGASAYGGSAGASPAAPVAHPVPAALPAGAAPHSVAATTQSGTPAAHLPAEFDAEQFLRHARLNFVNLQQAHDRRELSAIRDFLTPELYRDIEAEVKAAGDTPQTTDIVTLNAEVLDVSTENGMHIVSVRFSGLIREEAGAEAQPFSELWHLEKPTNGRSGWLVSGIQQA